jgi:hypothetical protein
MRSPSIDNSKIALKVMAELFRLVKREKDLHREIFTFLILHHHLTVIICNHYLVIDGNKTNSYQYPIYEFSFTALDGCKPSNFSTTSVNTSYQKQPQQLSHILFAIAIYQTLRLYDGNLLIFAIWQAFVIESCLPLHQSYFRT